ncbi:hypothetical protein C8J57DRAFT_1314254 [Mycena rebaudengoi]|nr:hypothetical protein C8J57DRAFT_1314254 [Mycena rebaudengoi]
MFIPARPNGLQANAISAKPAQFLGLLASDYPIGVSFGNAEDTKNYLLHLWNVMVSWLSDAFSAVMKWISDEAPIIVSAVIQPCKDHPYWALGVSGVIFLGPQILFLPLFIVHAAFFFVLMILGFGISGIVGGSPAALYQSLCYGGNTPSASLFAILQSIGMKYHAVTLGSWLLAVVRLIAALVFLYVAFFVLW